MENIGESANYEIFYVTSRFILMFRFDCGGFVIQHSVNKIRYNHKCKFEFNLSEIGRFLWGIVL